MSNLADHTQIQQILDSAQRHMEGAQHSTRAANRVLYSLITVLSGPRLTNEQQQQMEDILTLHERCGQERTSSLGPREKAVAHGTK